MKDASDLYLTTGAPASAKIQGQLTALEATPLAPGRVQEIADIIMDDGQKQDFKNRPECNMAISEPGVGRFRVHLCRQR
ncbi:MAG: type IV pili twitching motility protein PilT, partial [Pseudomonadota bacterium]|nr:type IV pili twitching motility protein PilT [Pseudomonadota bacterium]